MELQENYESCLYEFGFSPIPENLLSETIDHNLGNEELNLDQLDTSADLTKMDFDELAESVSAADEIPENSTSEEIVSTNPRQKSRKQDLMPRNVDEENFQARKIRKLPLYKMALSENLDKKDADRILKAKKSRKHRESKQYEMEMLKAEISALKMENQQYMMEREALLEENAQQTKRISCLESIIQGSVVIP